MLPQLLLFFSAAAGPGLPWTDDNYAKALAEARSRHVPMFVELWAPW